MLAWKLSNTVAELTTNTKISKKAHKMLAVLYILACLFVASGVVSGVPRTLAAIFENKKQVELGGSAKLTCNSITNYNGSVLMFNKTRIKEKQGKYQLLPSGAFLIKDVQPSETGMYVYHRISANDKHKNKNYYCMVKLQINEETIKVKTGSTTTIKCKVAVAGANGSEVEWRRKDPRGTTSVLVLVKKGILTNLARKMFSGRLAVSSRKLTISNSVESDSGKYTCIVKNEKNYQRELFHTNLIVGIPSTVITKAKDGTTSTSNETELATSFLSTKLIVVNETQGKENSMSPTTMPRTVVNQQTEAISSMCSVWIMNETKMNKEAGMLPGTIMPSPKSKWQSILVRQTSSEFSMTSKSSTVYVTILKDQESILARKSLGVRVDVALSMRFLVQSYLMMMMISSFI